MSSLSSFYSHHHHHYQHSAAVALLLSVASSVDGFSALLLLHAFDSALHAGVLRTEVCPFMIYRVCSQQSSYECSSLHRPTVGAPVQTRCIRQNISFPVKRPHARKITSHRCKVVLQETFFSICPLFSVQLWRQVRHFDCISHLFTLSCRLRFVT